MTEGSDRTPPHDVAAEQCTLGGMLLSADAIADVTETIRPDDHYRPAHQIIHEAILTLYEKAAPADPVSVADLLGKRGELARVGGAPYLHTLIASVPTAANAGYYARIVRERAVLRRLIEVGTRITQLGYSGDSDADELVDRAQAEAAGLAGEQLTETSAWLSEAVIPVIDSLDGPLPKDQITPPYADLKLIIPALRPGQLITVAARPSIGKTVVLGDFARHTALNLHQPVAWFTLEMSRDEIITRCIAAEARVNQHHIQMHEIEDAEWERIHRSVGAFTDCKILVDEKGASTTAHIRSVLRKMSRIAAPGLVVIDYLQLMKDPGARSRQEEVSELARGLKAIAKEFTVPVLAAAQLNRNPEGRQDKRPLQSDLRESGEIENSSDVIILLHREDYYERESPRAGEMDLIVSKNRNGYTADVTVAFQGRFCRCVSMAPEDANPPTEWSPSASLGKVA